MIPEFELWVKASNIDKMSKGACPLCHQWYMVAYILAENKLASFKVITVPENSPPKILKDKSTSGLFPVVVGIAGETAVSSIEDLVADESSELEKFFDSFKCPLLLMNSPGQTIALDCFIDLYRVFNLYLKSNTEKLRDKLNSVMTRIDNHLKENGTKFLDRDVLTYADCVLLPRLQHVRVAGKIYVDYDIPPENKYLYRYLQNAYATDAFIDTCPSDPVIINHYQKKAQKRGVEATLMKEITTLTIPDYIDLNINEDEEPTEEDVQDLSGQVESIVVDDGTPNGDTAVAADDLPSVSADDLPSVSADDLPSVSADDLPSAAADDLPSAATDDLPTADDPPAPAEIIANGNASSIVEEKSETEQVEPHEVEAPVSVEEITQIKNIIEETPEKAISQISENGLVVTAE